MPGGGTGFQGDDHGGRRYDGLYMGRVANRDDPSLNGRIRVVIPGLLDAPSAWAKPRGGGAPLWGVVAVPPLDADVYVQFINGDLDQPVYEPADMGIRGKGGEREMFPEHEHPDVIVAGFGPFRIVIDTRENLESGPTMRVKQVVKLPSGETDVAWIQFGENSIQVHADSVIQVEGKSLLDLSSDGDIQIKERKIMPSSKPIS